MTDKNEENALTSWAKLPIQACDAITAMKNYPLHPEVMMAVGKMCKWLANSGIVPKVYQNSPENIYVAIQAGAQIGLAPLQAMQSIAPINGNPALFGDGLLAVLLAHNCEVDEQVPEKWDAQAVAVCTITRPGRKPVRRTFTYEDAKRAGLVGKSGPWTSMPLRMLQMRARAFAARDSCADLLRGLKLYEEQRDITPDDAPSVQVEVAPAQIAQPIAMPQVSRTLTGETEPEVEATEKPARKKRVSKKEGSTGAKPETSTGSREPNVWLTQTAETTPPATAGDYWVTRTDADAPAAAFILTDEGVWKDIDDRYETDVRMLTGKRLVTLAKEKWLGADWKAQLLDRIYAETGSRIEGLLELTLAETADVFWSIEAS